MLARGPLQSRLEIMMRTQADLLSTMPTAPNARVGLRSWLFALVAVAGLASAAGREVHTFERAGLTIVVASSESEFSESRAYQVVVSDALRTLSRLEVNRDGVIADAWITDLDRDGAFEIIVATDLLAGEDRGAVDIHEWHDGRFASTAAAKLPAGDRSGYRGNDQFTVEDGQLWRAYPRFSAPDGEGNALPTGQMARYRYDFAANRWLRDGQ